MPKRSLSFLVGSVAGGSAISMGLRMVGGVLVGRLVTPATLGLFAGISLVLGYLPFLQLGILNGLNRELPYFIAKDDRTHAEELAAAAQAWALLVGGVAFVGLTCVAGWRLAQGEPWEAAAWFSNAILGFILFFSTLYLQMTFRTSHDFGRLAFAGVIESACGFALLSMVALVGFYGLCLRAVLAGAVSAVLLFRWRPVRVRPRWNRQHLKHLLTIGLPIFGVGQVYVWWTVLDSTLVLRLGGTRAMGLYSMVLLTGAALALVPAAVWQVLYPHMAEQYGRKQELRGLVDMTRRPIALTLAGLVPIVIAGWWLVGPLTRLVVPNYADAVPAMQWALLLPLVAAFQPVNLVFNVVRRQGWYLVAILTGMAVYGCGLMLLLRDGVDLPDFPQAMLIGRVVYMVICWAFIERLIRAEGRMEGAQ